MRHLTRVLAALVLGFGLLTSAAYAASDTLMLQLKDGTVEIKLRPDLAPKHVERITKLANEGFYDGIVFHRVIDGFMAQSGDPTGTGTGGSDLPDLKQEFSSQPFSDDRTVLSTVTDESVIFQMFDFKRITKLK